MQGDNAVQQMNGASALWKAQSSKLHMNAIIATMLDTLDDATAVERMCASRRLSSQGNLSIMPCRYASGSRDLMTLHLRQQIACLLV